MQGTRALGHSPLPSEATSLELDGKRHNWDVNGHPNWILRLRGKIVATRLLGPEFFFFLEETLDLGVDFIKPFLEQSFIF